MKLPTIKLPEELVKDIVKIAAGAAAGASATYLIMKIKDGKKRELTRKELEQLEREVYELYSRGIIKEDSFNRITRAIAALKS